MVNKASQDTDEQFKFKSSVVIVFTKSINDVVTLIGGKASTNQAFARYVGFFHICAIVTELF